eukprot:TRINITY_DN3286_c0_g1_i2.p1 TRINITY_DN3286_c0_g1~~TRINITY_DN3286_c0_g1_i2.p1  ORF type:complete len:107 (-),score=14.19 TRINITY_DN3286_c0_g1_i2:18-338(-)
MNAANSIANAFENSANQMVQLFVRFLNSSSEPLALAVRDESSIADVKMCIAKNINNHQAVLLRGEQLAVFANGKRFGDDCKIRDANLGHGAVIQLYITQKADKANK